ATATIDNAPGASVSLTVQQFADLGVSKTGPGTVTAGTPITYTITVSNGGPDTGSSVTLTDTLPAGETFASQSQPGTGPQLTLGHVGNAITDTISSLAAGASQVITVVANVPANVANNTPLSNTANVGTTDPFTIDSNATNNSSSAATTVVTRADLSVTKT